MKSIKYFIFIIIICFFSMFNVKAYSSNETAYIQGKFNDGQVTISFTKENNINYIKVHTNGENDTKLKLDENSDINIKKNHYVFKITKSNLSQMFAKNFNFNYNLRLESMEGSVYHYTIEVVDDESSTKEGAVCSFGNSSIYIECSASCDENYDPTANCVIKGKNSSLVSFDNNLKNTVSSSFIRTCDSNASIYVTFSDEEKRVIDTISAVYGNPQVNDDAKSGAQFSKYEDGSYSNCYVSNPNSCYYVTDIGIDYTCELKDGDISCEMNYLNEQDDYTKEHFDISKVQNNLTLEDFTNNGSFACPSELFYTQNYNNKTAVINKVSICKPQSASVFTCKSNCYNNKVKACSSNLGGLQIFGIDLGITKECSSYLGNPKISGTPAYYLQFIFDLIKYIAIIMLVVLTIVEYVKAVAAKNEDGIKKATQNTIKRVIIVVIIFLLPELIKFLLTVLGAYSPGTCEIS